MEKKLKRYSNGAFLLLFMAIPVSIYLFGGFARKSILKESISIITILSFCLIVAQFYLSRINKKWFASQKFSKLLKWHKAIGYIGVGIIFTHPFLIVLPRFFEAGISPWDAFVQMIKTVDNIAIICGIIAWILLLLLGITSFFRKNLNWTYTTWRFFHGTISAFLMFLAFWHVIEIGKHSNFTMILYYTVISAIAIFIIVKKYIIES